MQSAVVISILKCVTMHHLPTTKHGDSRQNSIKYSQIWSFGKNKSFSVAKLSISQNNNHFNIKPNWPIKEQVSVPSV